MMLHLNYLPKDSYYYNSSLSTLLFIYTVISSFNLVINYHFITHSKKNEFYKKTNSYPILFSYFRTSFLY